MIKQKTGKKEKINWRRRLYRIAVSAGNNTSLPEILFVSTFILIRWWNNSDFSYPSEILLPILAFSILATIIFYLYRWFLGAGLSTHIAALSLTYLLYVFQFVENSRPARLIYDWLPQFLSSTFTRSLILAALMGLVCGLAAWLIAKIINRWEFLRQLQLYKVLLFAVAFIFLLQIFRTGSRIYELRHQLSYKPPPATLAVSPSTPAVKPDIYYIVFDRYTSSEILKENFNYDNSELLGFLASQGFITRQRAYSNYPFTTSSIASTLSMDYFPQLEKQFGRDGRWQSAAPYRTILNDPPVAQILSQYGYSYNQVSSWWDFTRVGIKADRDPAKSYRLRVANRAFYLSDLQRDVFFKSILSPWLKKGITFGNTAVLKYDLDRNPRENFNAQVDSLKAISNRQDRRQPQFSFAHILAPHPPYVFDENGQPPPYDGESNDNGADESVKYTRQLAYVNKRIIDLISYIKQRSSNSVILLQPDEGAYPKQFRGPLSADRYYDPLELPTKEMRQKFGIMASYYLPGVTNQETAELNSSVNLFRFILNKYFGQQLDMLPGCNLSTGNKFNLYNFTAVNDRLTGEALPNECRRYE